VSAGFTDTFDLEINTFPDTLLYKIRLNRKRTAKTRGSTRAGPFGDLW
jgi:hypothetical protein